MNGPFLSLLLFALGASVSIFECARRTRLKVDRPRNPGAIAPAWSGAVGIGERLWQFSKSYQKFAVFSDANGGEGGIRTLGTPKELNSFRDCPVRPLRHLSAPHPANRQFALSARQSLRGSAPVSAGPGYCQALTGGRGALQTTKYGYICGRPAQNRLFCAGEGPYFCLWIERISFPAKLDAQSTRRAKRAAVLVLVKLCATGTLIFAALFLTSIRSLPTAKNGINRSLRKSGLRAISHSIISSPKMRNPAMSPMSVKEICCLT